MKKQDLIKLALCGITAASTFASPLSADQNSGSNDSGYTQYDASKVKDDSQYNGSAGNINRSQTSNTARSPTQDQQQQQKQKTNSSATRSWDTSDSGSDVKCGAPPPPKPAPKKEVTKASATRSWDDDSSSSCKGSDGKDEKHGGCGSYSGSQVNTSKNSAKASAKRVQTSRQ